MSKRQTLESAIRRRTSQLVRCGKDPNQASEILDLFLIGESVNDIARHYGISTGATRSQMNKEALYRCMKAQAVERLEELENVEKKL